ncbi:helix-turn-helix domain-containing protein [Shewanella colwelliana]|uniref:helix-turn-helix domain-containing protein n=1 Tax=Shewanella colwelliana TaxID=23 RepID=UPI00138AC5A8|nr:helix-turn-helix transcriptional regulator [Shewanella colwelliana]
MSALAVKAVRERRRMTQEDLAEKSNMSERQIQRIEDASNTRQTKQGNAERIAEALGISLDSLLQSPDSERIGWVVTQEGRFMGVRHEIRSLLSEIKHSAMPFENQPRDSTTLYIQSKTLPWGVTIEHHFKGGNEMSWEIRPVKYDEDIGLLWTEPDAMDDMLWEIDVAQLLYETAYDVIIDGKPVVPDDIKPQYQVKFFHQEEGAAERVFQGYQLIKDDSDLAISLGIWLSERKTKVHASLCSTLLGTLQIESGALDNVSLVVSRVWQDSDGQLQLAPWTYKHRESLVTSINKRHVDKQGPAHVTYSEPMRYNRTVTSMTPALPA